VSTTEVSLSEVIKTAAGQLGFELVGIAPAVTPGGIHNFLDWLERGYAGEMHYLPRREEAYEHPRNVLDGVRSIVMLGLNYNAPVPDIKGASRDVHQAPEGRPPAIPARIARYALGRADYHDVIRGKLKLLAEAVRGESPGCKVRGIVDTAPLLERDFARLAGLGWFGKNTILINKHLGSWFFLAALLVDIELEYDEPHAASHCGTCTRCLDSCPTDAFVGPYVLDARRCISYLTIEHRSSIPEELLPGIGDWLFGCDICQEVCPWNRKAPVTSEPAFQTDPALVSLDAAHLLSLTESEFEIRFGHTPLARPGRAGLVRNAAVVAGNSGSAAAVPALTSALQDSDSLARDAAALALECIRESETRKAPAESVSGGA
jgi:epoxyqueuosine reductase